MKSLTKHEARQAMTRAIQSASRSTSMDYKRRLIELWTKECESIYQQHFPRTYQEWKDNEAYCSHHNKMAQAQTEEEWERKPSW